jgi:spermidine/putrescine ABC transporter ATP-binding subunit
MSIPDIELRSVTKRFGKVEAVKDLDLSIEKGQLFCLLGPSGCGKTTTLRMIAGFEIPTKGRIIVQGEDITDLSPNKRNTGMVFQNYALFPHMTVFKNMAYGLENRKVSKNEIRRRVGTALEMVDMVGMEDRYPRQLSGGQQQRVAVARVLVMEPKILLFDEPLSNLDAKLRLQMRAEIRNLQKKVGITSLFVTHDQEEALSIADTVVVMDRGVIVQIGSPSEIYDAPRTRFMADFIGTSNIFEGNFGKSETGWPHRLRTTRGLEIFIEEGEPAPPGETLTVAVRPENMILYSECPQAKDMNPGDNVVPIFVENTLRMGPITQYSVRFETGEKALVQSQYRAEDRMFKEGDKAWLWWPCSSCRRLRE